MIDTKYIKNTMADNVGQKQATRIQHDQSVKNSVENKTSAGVRKKTVSKIVECKTCSERISQSISDGAGFLNVSPIENISSEVSDRIEQNSQTPQSSEVHQHTVSMHISVCPECGKSFMRGAPVGSSKTIIEEEAPTQGTLFDASI